MNQTFTRTLRSDFLAPQPNYFLKHCSVTLGTIVAVSDLLAAEDRC